MSEAKIDLRHITFFGERLSLDGRGARRDRKPRWEMEKVTVEQAVRQLKLELEACGLSVREVDARLERSVRLKFGKSKQHQLTFQELLSFLEAAEIDSRSFFARLLGMDGPLPFALLKPRDKPDWSRRRLKILADLETMTAAGSRGFEKVQARLEQLEEQFENQPRKAEAAAWRLLESCREPGAVVDILSMLATFLAPSRSYHLLSLATEILGPQIESAVGGRLASAIGRYYIDAGFDRDALMILQSQALPRVALFGNGVDQGQVYYRIARVAGSLGIPALQEAALKNAAAVGGERIRFAALQLLAFQDLNVGHASSAASRYDELVELPYFREAGRRARAYIEWSRMTAHLAAGRLGPDDEPGFRAVIDETKAVLNTRDQVAATLDFVLFLRSIGKYKAGGQYLEADFLNVVEIEDPDLQQKYAKLWNSLGLPDDARISVLVNRQASKSLPAHPRG